MLTDGTLLELQDVTLGYDRSVVLRNVQLRLRRGSFTGLLGANGSGKSTLIKTVLGVLPPLAGRIHFSRVHGREPILGYVPQREALDPIFLLSSFEVVLMGACGRVGPGRFFGRTERDWARNCLEQTGVADLAGSRFSQLSGGQKQRVLIARALAAKPDFLLLDEPTAGIDAAASQAIMELLRGIHAGHKMTLLMVNHDLGTVRKYVEQVIWLDEGRVLQGPASELLTRGKIEEILKLPLL
jgi:manganese/zinc/iron transport system ATP- binding protein